MAAARQFTIGRLMIVVVLIAVDFAVVRACWYLVHPIDWMAISVVCLPMANFLLLALPRLRSPGRSRWFWAGFEAAGWLGVLGLGVALAADLRVITRPIDWIEVRLPNWAEPQKLALEILVVDLLYTSVLLLIAGGTGWLAARCHTGSSRLGVNGSAIPAGAGLCDDRAAAIQFDGSG